MDRPQRIVGQVYGYTVCLVAVITFLISVASLVNSMIDIQDPLHVQRFSQTATPSLASYENYKMDILRSIPKDGDGVKSNERPDDQTLRGMYEAAKNDKIQTVLHDSNRTLVVDALLIVMSIGFFLSHWRWLRKTQRLQVDVPTN